MGQGQPWWFPKQGQRKSAALCLGGGRRCPVKRWHGGLLLACLTTLACEEQGLQEIRNPDETVPADAGSDFGIETSPPISADGSQPDQREPSDVAAPDTAGPDPRSFVQLSAGFSHTCALRFDGTVVCWGDDYYGESTPPSGTFTQIGAGEDYTCGLRADGSVTCWGDNSFGATAAPSTGS